MFTLKRHYTMCAMMTLALLGVMALPVSDEVVSDRPKVRQWKIWVLAARTDIQVPAPPAETSDQTTAELAELRQLQQERLPSANTAIHTAPTPEVLQVLAPTGKLRVGLYPGGPTSMIRDPASGETKGLAFELGKGLDRRLGVAFEPFVYRSNAEALEALKAGQVDAAFTNATAARAKDMDFTPRYLEIEQDFRGTALIAAGVPGVPGPAGKDGRDTTTTLPAQDFGYVMSQVSSTILVVDTSTNEIIKKVTHPDMAKPAGGRFHPSKQRYYAGGTGKVTIWDTTDVAHPVYLKTVIPAPGSAGEYRGFLIYQGSTTAIDGNVWMANIQDSKVYVYRAADLEGAHPTPVKVFDATTDGISFPHFMMSRPGTQEVWLTNRPVNANGYLLRFNGETHTVLTTPTATLETTSTTGDEPNEFSFSKDGMLAYVGHHGAILTGSPTNQMHVAIVDAATFTVKKLIPMIASATVPGYVDIDLEGGRVYFATKWSPNLVVFDSKTEHVLRYIELGGFGPGYGVALTPDKTRLYIPLGVPAQSAVAVVDAKTLTIVANIVDPDLNGPRLVRFTNY